MYKIIVHKDQILDRGRTGDSSIRQCNSLYIYSSLQSQEYQIIAKIFSKENNYYLLPTWLCK